MKRTVLILLTILTFSCKENKQEKPKNNKEKIETQKKQVLKKEKDNVFKLQFDIKLLENDKFRVFYAENSLDEKFNGEQMIVTSIKGSPEFQTVSIKLPANILPYKLRVDVGENGIKNETVIEFKSIKLELNGNNIIINNDIMNNFFKPNSYLEKTEKGFKRKVVKGKYDPFLVSTALLNKKIEIEL